MILQLLFPLITILISSTLVLWSRSHSMTEWRYGHSSKLSQRPPVKAGRVSPPLSVPANIFRPPYAGGKDIMGCLGHSHGHSPQDIEGMRLASRLAAQALRLAESIVQPGITTDYIDMTLHEFITSRGGYPSPLNYLGYPKSICTSVNEVICHGIPDDRPLEDGDIIKTSMTSPDLPPPSPYQIDVSVYLNGYHGDTCATFPVGQVRNEVQQLIQVTREALASGINVCAPGVRYSAIGAAIQSVAEVHHMGIVTRFSGHGIGHALHTYPQIDHASRFWLLDGTMQVNETFTIEPMLIEPGGWNWAVISRDRWTASTIDRSLVAQFEHTILVVEDGAEILSV